MRKLLLFISMAFFFVADLQAQSISASGVIIDEKGGPVAGASILEKGTKNGTTSGSDGAFTLKVKSSAATLVISSIGYTSTEVKANQKLNIQLKQSSSQLSEVVVTALGISREKKAISYSAQTIGSESIAASGKSNLVDGLQGKVSGVQITSTGGQVGGGSTIVIRGYNSLTGNNQPLYVVDGVPIDNTTDGGTSSQYNYPSANRAIDINPDDIENLTILKGGAATALYGIQASNGAIIINTKKGKAGKASVEFSYNNSTATANKFQETTKQWLRGSGGIYTTNTSNMWGPNAFSNPTFPAGSKMDLIGDGDVIDVSGQPIPFYPNNFENFYKTGTGKTNKYNLAISGANDKTTYYTAFSRLDQEGVIKNNTYQKTDFVLNVTNNVSDRLKIGTKINYINTGGNRYDQGGFTNRLAYYLNTFDILTYHTLNKNTGQESYWNNGQQSPMWMVENGGEKYNINRLITNVDVSYKVSNTIRIDYKGGMDQYTEDRKRYDKIGTWGYSSNNYTGSINIGRSSNMQLNSELIVHFDKKLNNDFNLRTFVGQNAFYKKYDFLNNFGNSFVLPDLYDITNTQTQTISHSSYTKQTLAVYGDAQLDYKNFLYLEGTLRRDWSSTLPRTNMGFTYPSVSVGYIFSEHIKAPWLTFGKIRASYAGTSNDAPVNALQTSYNNITPAILGNVRFSYPTVVGNPLLKPESTTQKEIGLDLGLFKRKITFEGAYYMKNSFDQIIYAPASSVTGVNNILINLGQTTNKGVDATLSFNNIVNIKGFSWTSAFNFSKNESLVEKVGENGNDKVALLYGYNTTTEIDAVKGQSFGAIYGYAWKRYGKSPTDAGYLNAPLLLNAAGQPQKDAVKTLLGNTTPDFILGWNNTLSYKNFNFGFTFDWKKGGNVINDYNAMITYSGKSILTDKRYYDPTVAGAPKDVLSTRTYVGVDATGKPVDVPVQLTKTWYTTVVYKVDENYVEDASWLRLRNIYLTYSIPEKLLKPLHMKAVDVTFAGRNVWLKTKYSGVDPEVSSAGSGPNATTGIDIAGIPSTKSWDFGVKVKF
jgi:TonB-linked SusC/RagA family outer membrane protein